MAIKIPADVREAMTEIARRFGRRLVGKTAAKNMAPEERLARPKKTAKAAADRRESSPTRTRAIV